jgi:hypothetical protein
VPPTRRPRWPKLGDPSLFREIEGAPAGALWLPERGMAVSHVQARPWRRRAGWETEG